MVSTSLVMVLVLCASLLSAAFSAIGVGKADGRFRVAGVPVTGARTLKEGATVETESMPARLTLYSGASIDLGPASRVKVFPSRLVLESGTVTVQGQMQVFDKHGILVAQVIEGSSIHLTQPRLLADSTTR